MAVDFLHPIEISVSIHKNEWTESNKGSRRIFGDTMRIPVDFYRKNIESLISATKSIAFFSEGSMPLWTIRPLRKTKKVYKLHHTPNSELVMSAEDNIRSFIREKLQGKDKFVSEVVISGCCEPGATDTKICSWAADLRARGISRNERIAIVGNPNQYITLMGMMPFHNMSFFALAHQHSYQFHFYDMLEYFGLLPYAHSKDFSRIRADMVLMMLMAYGLKWADMSPLHAFTLKSAMDTYHQHFLEKGRFLFDEKLRLDIGSIRLLMSLSRMSRGANTRDKRGQECGSEYLQILLQTHYALCTGRLLHNHFDPKSYNQIGPSQNITVQNLIMALENLSDTVLSAIVDPRPAINGLEYAMAAIGSEFATQHTSLPKWIKAHRDPLAVHKKMMEMIEAESLPRAIDHARELCDKLRGTVPDRVYCSTQSMLLRRNCTAARNTCTMSPFTLGALSQSKPNERLIVPECKSIIWDPALRQQTKPIFTFDRALAVWTKKSIEESNQNRTHTAPTKLSVITWNVLFDKFNNEKTFMGKPAIDRCSTHRFAAILKLLEQSKADVICLQEVMQDFYQLLVDQSWVRHYTLSCDRTHADINPWGSLILCHTRHKLIDSVSRNLPGYNSHISLMPEFSLKLRDDAAPLKVSCCHLMSSYDARNDAARKTQIVNLISACSGENTESAIRMGDFNQDFTFPAALNFQDAWIAAGRDDREGWTIDNSRNGLADRLIEEQFNGRYDRIFYKSKNLRLQNCFLIGDKPVSTILGQGQWPDWLFCSDHFGIQADFEIC